MKYALTALVSAFALAYSHPAKADALTDAVRKDMPGLLAIYRDLHANPELSFAETRSAAIMAAEARKLGFAVTTGVGKTGVVAVLRNGPGPVMLIRADMDGLPVKEVTGLPFASKVMARNADGSETPVMHACGHDTHMTAWIGTARRLAAMKAAWSGTLVMIGQPAEELGEGAQAMVNDGLYTRFPKPDVALAFHDSAELPVGTISYVDGYATANVDAVEILVRGIGGHGAYPHLSKDPVLLAARIVVALQMLVARELNPKDPGVVTVGAINGGTKGNIIPDEVRLQLTVRSYSPEARNTLIAGIKRIASGEAAASGIPADRMPIVTDDAYPTPSIFNTQPFTGQVVRLLQQRFGTDKVVAIPADMGGEDFSVYRAAAPGIQSLMFHVGGVPQAQWDAAGGDLTKLPALHSGQWAPDADGTISTAIEGLTRAAMMVLAK